MFAQFPHAVSEELVVMHYLVMRLGAVLAVAGCNASTFSQIEESRPITLSEGQVSQIHATVMRDFFDPESARFGDLRAVDATLADGSREARVCGEVNGKNRMGGYVGYTMFGGVLQDGNFVQRDFFAPCEPW